MHTCRTCLNLPVLFVALETRATLLRKTIHFSILHTHYFFYQNKIRCRKYSLSFLGYQFSAARKKGMITSDQPHDAMNLFLDQILQQAQILPTNKKAPITERLLLERDREKTDPPIFLWNEEGHESPDSFPNWPDQIYSALLIFFSSALFSYTFTFFLSWKNLNYES